MDKFLCEIVFRNINTTISFMGKSTGFAFRFEHRKWNRGRNGLHQLGQPVGPSILFPVFKSEGKPGTLTHKTASCINIPKYYLTQKCIHFPPPTEDYVITNTSFSCPKVTLITKRRVEETSFL